MRWRKFTIWLMAIVLSLGMIGVFPVHPALASANPCGFEGSGTDVDPFKLGTADELYCLSEEQADYLDSHFILIDDIDFAGWDWASKPWIPIGYYDYMTDDYFPFEGSFDGNHHQIHNLRIDQTYNYLEIGMFGSLRRTAEIRDVELVDVVVEIEMDADIDEELIKYIGIGALAGYHSGLIANTGVSGSIHVVLPEQYGAVGGLAGFSDFESALERSSANVNVTVKGGFAVGGLAGLIESEGVIKDSSAAGIVRGNNTVYAGGLVGNANGGIILSSHSSAEVEVEGIKSLGAGGLVGGVSTYLTYSNYFEQQIRHSRATGNVKGEDNVGGLIGAIVRESHNDQLDVFASHATGNVEGRHQVGGLIGGNHYDDAIGGWPFQIVQTHASGTVSGKDNVGGLIGLAGLDEITDSFATGNVTGENRVGGLIGLIAGGEVIRSHASGHISGTEAVGGLVGRAVSSRLERVYAKGTVNGGQHAGALAGDAEDVKIVEAYASGALQTERNWSDEVNFLIGNGNNIDYLFVYGLKHPDDDGLWMRDQTSYGGFDFSIHWAMIDGIDTPYLRRNEASLGLEDAAKTVRVENRHLEIDGYVRLDLFCDGWDVDCIQSVESYVLHHIVTDADGHSHLAGSWDEPVIVQNNSKTDFGHELDLSDLPAGSFRLIVWSTTGGFGLGPEVIFLEIPPGAPRNVRATPQNGGAVLTWDPVPANPGATVTYAVYQYNGTPPVDPNVSLAGWLAANSTVTTATYSVDGMTNGLTYAFTVKAIVDGMDSPYSPYSAPLAVIPKGAPGGGTGPGGSSGGSAGGEGETVDDGEPIRSTDGNIVIPAGRSGEVSLDGEVVLHVPEGVEEEELLITIEKWAELGELPDQDQIISSVFEIVKNVSGNFQKPVTLTLKFDPSKVGENQRPSIFYLDEEKGAWIEVGGTADGEWITVEVDHFTKFAVLLVESDELPPAFADIKGHWAEEEIRKAAARQLVSGYPDGTFQPNRTISRAEFTVMLVNALNLQGAGAPLAFTDNDRIGGWAKPAVARAVEAGFVRGYTDGSFRPGAPVTRAEMAVMIAGAPGMASEGAGETSFVDDASIPAWAKGSVERLGSMGTISGKAGNRFAPQDQATRAEAAAMLVRLVERLEQAH